MFGRFYKGSPIGVLPEDAEDIDTDNDPAFFLNNEAALIYRQSFSVDEELGLVTHLFADKTGIRFYTHLFSNDLQ